MDSIKVLKPQLGYLSLRDVISMFGNLIQNIDGGFDGEADLTLIDEDGSLIFKTYYKGKPIK